MDKRELIENFEEVLKEAMKSNDKEDILMAVDMFKKTFMLLVETNVRDAKEVYECFEGTLKYNNFLTESEAMDVVDHFINQDGSKGPKWRDAEDLFKVVEEMGGKPECSPYYNKWALYVTMNKFFSDQNSAILKWVGDNRDKYIEACYDLSVSQLKDKDHPNWVRWYFKVEDKF